ncbi:hypothetical protein GGI21_003281 [Coemansia aciculifera]|nr:hypothetical protein GGI21_003281 [Coemansia aciculifera]
MSDCKAHFKELQQDTTSDNHPASKRRRSRRRNHPRHRSPRQHRTEPVTATTAADDYSKVSAETERQRQQAAVNTIEDHILGARKAQESMRALHQLHAVEKELDAIRSQYNQQVQDMQLSFVADKSGGLRLAYNGGNRPFLMYQDTLQRLLSRLDEIPSHGDEVVRAKRKAVVVKIQDTLEALDRFAADQEEESMAESTGSATNDPGVLADDSSVCD